MATDGSSLIGRLVDRRARRGLTLVVIGVLSGIGYVPAVASAKAQKPVQPVVVHLRFQKTGKVLGGVQSNGRYVFEALLDSPSGFLVDSLTGQRRAISRPGCEVPLDATVLGGPWLMFSCGQGVTLYSVATGAWRSVALPPDWCALYGEDSPPCEEGPVRVGAHWIEWDLQPYHGGDVFYFQNIRTGAVEPQPPPAPRTGLPHWRAGGTIYPNLDSAQLTTTLCSPLRVPSLDGGPGDVSFYGRVAIAYGGTVSYPDERDLSMYLERCGSRTRTRLDVPLVVGGSIFLTDFPPPGLVFTANAHELMWIKARRQLAGVFLPSMRAFTVPLPATITAATIDTFGVRNDPSHIALGSQTLYLVDVNWKLWTAPAPTISQAPR